MQELIYFVFSLDQQLYGIKREFIEEVLLLPEFALTPEVPDNIVGVINLRGVGLPLIVLNPDTDRSASDYRLTDKVIVLRCADLKVGIIVHRIHEEITVTHEEIEAENLAAQYSIDNILNGTDDILNGIVAGCVSREDIILLLKNPEAWIAGQTMMSILNNLVKESSISNLVGNNASQSSSFGIFLSETLVSTQTATAQERRIFRERADSLRQSLPTQELEEGKPLAVVALGGHIWGVDLEFVREFIDVRHLTPIPCCPKHIVGNTNYRSEVLTLIDVRQALRLPLPETLDRLKAIVVEAEDVIAGVVVDGVYDAMFFLNSQNRGLETETASFLQNEYLQSTAFYGTEIMGILNLPKLLSSTELQVDEAL